MSIHRLLPVLLLSLLGPAAVHSAEQVEVHLRSGDVITGELVSQDDVQVLIKTSTVGHSGKTMTMTAGYRLDAITSMIKLGDPEEVFAQRAAAAASAADHATLAAWCREHGLPDHAVEEAQKALAMEAGNTTAAALMTDLGWVSVDAKWVREAEWLAKQGKVRYQGRIITNAEMDAIRAQQHQQQLQAEAQKAVDDRAAAVAVLDARLADFPKRPAQIDADIAKDHADIATAQGLAQTVSSDKAAVEAAQKNLDQARAAKAGTQAASSANIASLFTALETAQKAYNAARREAGAADQTIAGLTAAIARLTDEKTHLDKEKERLVAQRAEAQQELVKARATLAALANPAAPATP